MIRLVMAALWLGLFGAGRVLGRPIQIISGDRRWFDDGVDMIMADGQHEGGRDTVEAVGELL